MFAVNYYRRTAKTGMKVTADLKTSNHWKGVGLLFMQIVKVFFWMNRNSANNVTF